LSGCDCPQWHPDEGKNEKTGMKTMETTEAVSSHSGETGLESQKNIETPPVPEKNPRRTEKRTCKSVEQEENHEKGLRWSWTRNHMGNPSLGLTHRFDTAKHIHTLS
jgi:hypothetical protein